MAQDYNWESLASGGEQPSWGQQAPAAANPNQGTIDRYTKDYWAPDRESVLKDLSAGNWYGGADNNPLKNPWSLPMGGGGGVPANYPPAPKNTAKNSGNVQQDWTSFIGGKGAIPYQDFRTNLPQYVNEFNQQYGYGVQATGRPGDYDTIQLPSGQIIDVHSSQGQNIWNPEGGGGFGGGGSQWGNDPATQQYQDFLNTFLGQLGGQANQWGQDATQFRAQQQQAQAATQRLIDYLGQRAQTLQGPAYSGPQQEILRTQVLDPIERDRTAAKQRALERISARGMDPTSGIAQELMNQTDSAFDQNRAAVQNNLGYQQIHQEHANQQEAQQLLALIPQAQRAGMTGDMSFLSQLNQASNQPYQTGVPLSQEIYNLPNQALQNALATLNIGPNPGAVSQSAYQLGALNQNAQNQGTQWYEQLGSLLPYMTGLFQ